MLRKTRRNKFPKIFFFIIFLFVQALSVSIFYKFFFSKRTLYLSPLSSQKEAPIKSLEKTLIKADISFSQIVASDSSYLVFLKNGERIILPSDADVKNRIDSLQLILKQFTIEGKKFKQIDLRFDKPTILF